jgi:photosystem II stability/assembly factor-like uncharacterized protein
MNEHSAFAVLERLDPAQHQADDSDPQKLLQRILDTPRNPTQTKRDHRPRAKYVDTRPLAPRLLVACGVAAIVLAASIAVVSIGSNRTVTPKATQTTAPHPNVHWQLAAALTGTQFQIATGNPDAVVGVTCSDGSTCLLSTGYGLDFGGGGSMFVSHDGGHTWGQSSLPPNVAVTALASCPTDAWCAAGGGLLDAKTGDPAAKKPMRDPELLVSTDGGSSWTERAVPLPVEVQQLPAYNGLPAETTYWPGEIDSIACSSQDVCNVLGQAQINQPNGPDTDELLFLTTTDGGAHWTSRVLPAVTGATTYQLVMYPGSNEAMSCSTALACTIAATPVFPQALVTWRTQDGGKTWHSALISGGHAGTPSLSCPSASTCLLSGASLGSLGAGLLKSNDGGLSWSLVKVPAFPPLSGGEFLANVTVSCQSETTCFVSSNEGLAATQDGGSTWQDVSLPSGVGEVLQVSCVARGNCAAVANPAQRGAPNQYGGGSMILTNDTASPR